MRKEGKKVEIENRLQKLNKKLGMEENWKIERDNRVRIER